MRLPEYMVDLVEYSDFMYYAAHLNRELIGFDELDDCGQIAECLAVVLQAKDDIESALESLLGKYM